MKKPELECITTTLFFPGWMENLLCFYLLCARAVLFSFHFSWKVCTFWYPSSVLIILTLKSQRIEFQFSWIKNLKKIHRCRTKAHRCGQTIELYLIFENWLLRSFYQEGEENGSGWKNWNWMENQSWVKHFCWPRLVTKPLNVHGSAVCIVQSEVVSMTIRIFQWTHAELII